MANYREPQWLLPNEKNLAMPASDATVGSGLAEDRQSLYSMDFDGSNDYIDCGDNDLLSFGNGSSDFPFTVSSWIYAKGSSTFPFFDKYPDAGTWALREYRMEVFGTDKVVLIIYDGSAAARHEIYSDSLITRDQWQHITITYDGRGGATAGDGVKIYINGSESTTTIVSYGTYVAMENTTSPVRIGRIGSTYADGKIDETAVWNKALSASEVSALTTANAPANILALSDKPVAYWPLGEQARRGSEWQFPNEVLQSQVFDFDGSTDYISAGSLSYITSNVFTISGWVKTATSLPTYMPLFNFQNSSGTGSKFNWNHGGSPILWYSGSTYKYFASGAWRTDGLWHNIVLTIDRTTIGNSKMYIDGVEISGGATSGSGAMVLNDLHLGYNPTTQFYDGEMSNVAIWNSDQSANIANIYNNGSPQSSYTTTPTAWYKLNATSNYAGLNPNFHNALDFSGSSQYIDCGTGLGDSLGTYTGDLTLSYWFNTDSLIDNRGLFSLGSFSNAQGEFQVNIFSNSMRFRVDSGTQTKLLDISSLSTGIWYHICFVYKASDISGSKVYLNGAEQTTSDTGTFPSSLSFTGLKTIIGGYYGTGNTFDGKMSNTAIFNQAISAEDVLYLYNGGTPQTNISFEPTSWWKLDNLTTGIQDSGSASNNGTNNGATEVTDSVAVDQWNFDNVSQAQTPNYSSALNFDGNNDYINSSYTLPASTTTFSASMWVNTASLSTLQGLLGSQDSSSDGYWVSISSNNINFKINGTTSSATTTSLSVNTWFHLVVTYDGSTAKIYLNNNAPVSNSVTETVNVTANTIIGRLPWAAFYYLNGSISNAAIYNTTLSAADVETLFNIGNPQSTILGSPQAWWKLDSTTITDSSGNGNTGTNNGATEIQTNVWTPRLNGESTTLPSTALVSSDLQFESPYSNFSLDFDGTNDYIDGNTASYLNATTTFTISTWFNTDTVAGTDKFLINIGGSSSELWGIQLYNGNLVVYGGSTSKNLQYNGLISINTWYSLALVYDGGQSAADRYKVYLNGVLLTPTTTVGTIDSVTPTFTNNLTIGKLAYSAAEYWNGKIDETAIWSSALTQAQVSQVYNNGYPADLTSLSPVSWWRLGEDAYFVSPNFTVPNQITGAPNGTSANMDQADLVADAPGSYASGIGSSLALADRVGDAPESTANSLSFNMTPLNKISYPAGYAPTQVDNVYSMDFNGLDSYYNISPSSDFTFGTNGFAISMWVKRLTSGISYPYLIDFRDSEPESTLAFYYNESNGKLECWINGIAVISNSSGTKTLPLNDWAHVVLTREGTTLSTFVDGELDQSVTNSSNLISTTSINVGRRYNSVNYFEGNIDEVAIFNYGLSARQIKQDIYNGTTTGKTADLNNISNLTAPVAWYRLGD